MMPRTLRPIARPVALIAAIGALLAGACTAPMTLREPPSDPPGDFGLAVALVPAARAGSATPDGTRAARYILEPDGSLRAATGGGAGPGTLPPIVRRVDSGTRARLWRLALATGVHDPAPDERVASPELYRAPAHPTALISIAWGEGRSSAAYRADEPAARALLDELGALAWVGP